MARNLILFALIAGTAYLAYQNSDQLVQFVGQISSAFRASFLETTGGKTDGSA